MKTRVITAVVLLPLLLLVVLAAPKICTVILCSALCAVAAFELLSGTGMVKQPRIVAYCMTMAALTVLHSCYGWPLVWAQLGILLFFVLLFLETMLCDMKLPFEKVAVCFIGGLLLPYMLGSLARIHSVATGRFYIMIPFVLAFLSDSGAYFVGCAMGKHKLAPTISPKKTVEGVVGGILGAVLGMVLYCLILQLAFGFKVNYLFALIYGILGSLCGVFGDLCFSVIKRQTGIKDYGNLMPGHGGVLDRFDSMVLVGPLSEILLTILPVAVL